MVQSKQIQIIDPEQSIEDLPNRWNKPTLSGLEADIAYFDARIEFVGNPTTINQKDQLIVFKALIESTNRILKHMR